MCGRYVLHLRPSEVRQRLEEQDMPSDSAPDDDNEQLRQTFNFAPGYHGLIYRADTTDYGTPKKPTGNDDQPASESPSKKVKAVSSSPSKKPVVDGLATKETKYKIQAAKWGLVPFWTKRPPDYASQMRTINCRDDSLLQSGGMWNTMKQRKRCIVIAEGFYEWLKKNEGKERLPYYMKRKDGGLLCLAGLWDSVTYEGQEDAEKLYSYTIITTDSNSQLKFLHDRMPVVMEPGSEAMKAWLNPNNIGWSRELQDLLKPFDGELECYPVDKAVGKVGNNSPSFTIPIDSKENKNNIANFFSNQGAGKSSPEKKKNPESPNEEAKSTKAEEKDIGEAVPQSQEQYDADLQRAIEESKITDSQMNPAADQTTEANIKQEVEEVKDAELLEASNSTIGKRKLDNDIKKETEEVDDKHLLAAASSPPMKAVKTENVSPTKSAASPSKASPTKSKSGRKTRSATSNDLSAKSPSKDHNQKITSFFGGK